MRCDCDDGRASRKAAPVTRAGFANERNPRAQSTVEREKTGRSSLLKEIIHLFARTYTCVAA